MKEVLFAFWVVFGSYHPCETQSNRCDTGSIMSSGYSGRVYWYTVKNHCTNNLKTFIFEKPLDLEDRCFIDVRGLDW